MSREGTGDWRAVVLCEYPLDAVCSQLIRGRGAVGRGSGVCPAWPELISSFHTIEICRKSQLWIHCQAVLCVHSGMWACIGSKYTTASQLWKVVCARALEYITAELYSHGTCGLGW